MAATNTNNAKSVARLTSASRVLDAALEEARASYAEYIRLGGRTWTDPFFYVNGDVAGALRTDLTYTKDDLVNAAIGLDAVEAAAAGYRNFYSKVK